MEGLEAYLEGEYNIKVYFKETELRKLCHILKLHICGLQEIYLYLRQYLYAQIDKYSGCTKN